MDYGGGMPQTGTTQTYSYTPNESDAEVRAWITLLDNTSTVEAIEHYLNGEEAYIDPATKRWTYRRVRTPLVNKEGINKILYILTPYLSPIFSLSNYKIDEISARCLELAMNLTWNLAIMQDRYDINPNDLSLVKNMVVNCTEANLRKAKDGNLVQIFSKTQSTREVISSGDRSGFFGKVLNKFG